MNIIYLYLGIPDIRPFHCGPKERKGGGGGGYQTLHTIINNIETNWFN